MALTKVSGDFIKAGSITQGHLHSSHGITTSHIAEGDKLFFTNARVDSRVGSLSTSNLSEGTNLYYTDARVDARIALQVGGNLDLSSKSTSDLSEGTNLYYTQARFNTAFTAKSTSDLSEGTNLYYTDARADARIAAADTDSLSEGSTNLYYTDARADARVALIVDSAPGTLNTLNELAAALGDDANFSTTVTNSIATKLPLAGGTLTGALQAQPWLFRQMSNQVEYHVLDNGSINGPSWKFRYDGATANRYVDFGYKDGNGTYTSGLKLYNNQTVSWRGTDIINASGQWTGGIASSGYNDSNWNTAYGWGDHAAAGYITGYTESDTLATVTARGASTSTAVTFAKATFNTSSTGLPRQITIKEDGDTENSMGSYPGAWTSALNIQSNDASTYLWLSPLTSNIPRIQTNYGQLDFYTGNNTNRALHLSGTSARSEIFYSSSDTSYYLYPNNQLSLKVYGEIANSNYAQGSLQPGAINLGRTDTDYRWDGTTWASDIKLGMLLNFSEYYEIGFHDSGDSVNSFVYYNGTDFEMGRDIGWGTQHFTFTESVRSPIFYDSNNTGYYINPASTSILNRVEINDDLDVRAQTGTWITSNIMGDAIGWNPSYGVYIGSNVGGTHYLRGNGTFTTNGSTYNLWHQGNDGSGSGLDADLLDGQQGSYYNHRAYTANSNYLGGHYTSGGTEKPNSSALGAGKLKLIMLGSSNLGFGGSWNDVLWMSAYTGGDVKRSTALVSSKYDNTSLWIVKQNFDSSSWGTSYLFWNSGNDGSGSGLDADLLDGNHASAFANVGGSSTTNFDTRAIYPHEWIRMNGNSNHGIYWQNGTGAYWHIYPKDQNDMRFRTGSANGGIVGTIANETARGYIHWTTSNEIGFLNSSRSWSLRVDNSGNTFATSSHRAPIFYDSNDTAYYIDLNAGSRLHRLGVGTTPRTDSYSLSVSNIYMGNTSIDYVNQLHFYDNVRFYDDGNDSYLNFKYGDSNYGGIVFYNGSTARRGFVYADSAGFGMLDSDGQWSVRIPIGGVGLELRSNNNVEFTVNNDHTLSHGSSRAPIFYDSNNTAYYTRPHTYSYMNQIWTAGTIQAGSSGTGNIYLGNNGVSGSGNHFRFHTNNSQTYFDMNCGTVNWRQGSSTRYYFYPSTANMTINGTLTQYSDIRYKENIVEIPDAIDKIKSIRGVYYNRTDFNTEPTKIGVIAQEVEVLMPELILQAEDTDLKSVSYNELTAVLVQAIKEQQTIIDDLKSRLETLENQ